MINLINISVPILLGLTFPYTNLTLRICRNISITLVTLNLILAFLLDISNLQWILIMLTLLLGPVLVLSSENKDILSCILIIQGLLVAAFTTQSVLWFFIIFESVLLPLYWLIAKYGSSSDRVLSGYQLFYFTVIGSLIWLIGILITNYIARCNILSINTILTIQIFILPFYLIPMLIKLPTVPLHTWLNEAHTEAPTTGSIVLAALILKLAGYGIIKWILPYFSLALEYYIDTLYLLAILSIILTSLSALRQIDLKRTIAYASVAHMNVVLFGLLNLNSVEPAILLMIGHGFVSALLFYLIGTIYNRYHTRIIYYIRGLFIVSPIFSTYMILASLFNAGFPPSVNWLSELSILSNTLYSFPDYAYTLSIGILLAIVYSLWLFTRICFNDISPYLTRFNDLTRLEFYICTYLTLLTIIVTFYGSEFYLTS